MANKKVKKNTEKYITVITNRNNSFIYTIMSEKDRDYIHDCVNKGDDFFITLAKVEYSLGNWKNKSIIDIRVMDITNMELLECVEESDDCEC